MAKAKAEPKKAAKPRVKKPSENFRKTSVFEWTPDRSNAAVMLAQGYTQREVAEVIGVTDRTLRTWNSEIEFSAEVDRLSLMVDVSSRAERLRLAMRVVRQKTQGGAIDTDKDLLDWLKFAQSETDGIKLDIAAVAEAAAPVAGSGQN